MSKKEEGWLEISRFAKAEGRGEQEKKRVQEIAMDLGLLPEMVVALEEEGDKEVIYIHPEFYSYYQG